MIYFFGFLVCLIIAVLVQRISAKYFIRRRKMELRQRCQAIVERDRSERPLGSILITGIVYGSDDTEKDFKPMFKAVPIQHRIH